MTRYPGAVWNPFPENATQTRIRPTQVIHHVTASSGPISGTYKYFAMETIKVESHFGVDHDGTAWQGIDTDVRADANLEANRRPDGTGAISVETAGTEFGTWTEQQIDWLVAHGVWCHEVLGIPLRICRTPDDPGFGYHTLFGAPSAWTPVSKTCPGPNRIKQWRQIVFPRIEAKDVTDMELSDKFTLSAGVNAAIPGDLGQMEVDSALGYGAGSFFLGQKILARLATLESAIAVLAGKPGADVDEEALAQALVVLLPALDTASILAAIQALPAETVKTIKAAL